MNPGILRRRGGWAASATLATVVGLSTVPALADDTATEGLAICTLQGIDPDETHRFVSIGPLPQVSEYARSHPKIEPRFIAGMNFGAFRDVMLQVIDAVSSWPKEGFDHVVDPPIGGVFLFDTDIKDRGDGGVYGKSIAAHGGKPQAYKCEVIEPMKVCTGNNTEFYLPCKKQAAAKPAAPARVDASATEGLAFCSFRGRDKEQAAVFYAAGEIKEASDYVVAKEPNITLKWYQDGYKRANLETILNQNLQSSADYYSGRLSMLYDNGGGLFLYDKDVRKQGDGGTYGASLAQFAKEPGLYDCTLVTAEKVCQPEADKAFFTRCEG